MYCIVQSLDSFSGQLQSRHVSEAKHDELRRQRKRLADSIMRDAIYDGVMEVLDEHGLAGATMDRIAATVGVARESLQPLPRARMTCSRSSTTGRSDRCWSQPSKSTTDLAAADKIEAMIRNWQRYVGEHRATFQIFANYVNVEGGLKQAMAESESAAIELTLRLITEGIEAGEFRPVKAHFVAEMLLVAVKKMLSQQLKDAVPGIRRRDGRHAGRRLHPRPVRETASREADRADP